ncbi:MAG: hypothetical protein PHT33_14110 [bacterium]|nr:hypothetical protein [bacterium]
MASITKKNINGHQYYYARECRRVNGKPKIVWQKYLGKADDIIKAMAQIETPEPQEADVVEFGLTTALYDVATRLNLVDTIDYVGSLVPSQHADLLAIPLEEYIDISKGHKAYMSRKKVFGKEHVICLAFSEELYRCQMRGLRLQLDKREKHLKALQQKLEARKTGTGKRGRKPTVAGVTRMVTAILKGQHMKEVIQYSVGEENGQVFLHYFVDEAAISQIAATRFGKNILFTDRQDMDAATIVETYHTQYKIEDAFKQMKNPHHVSFSPIYHWTDQKLRVHAFYCVLALTLSSLLQRQLHRAGIEISMEKMHEQLSSIKELLLLYPAKNGKVKAVTTLSKKNAIQNQVFKVLDLKRFV